MAGKGSDDRKALFLFLDLTNVEGYMSGLIFSILAF